MLWPKEDELGVKVVALVASLAALAVGVPHDTLGEVVVVCAVAHPGRGVDEDDVRHFLRGRLASYKIPRHVLFFDDDDLVLTGNAKIRTEDLRRLAADRLGARR